MYIKIKKIMMKFMSTKMIAVVSLFSLLQMMVSCGGAPQGRPEVEHKTMTVEKGDRTVKNFYTSSIKGQQNVEIRPQINGVITKICIKEGAKVHNGQLLFVIDQAPYIAALETAKANVQSAQAKLSNAELVEQSQKELFKEGVVADFDMQKAINSTLEAKALLAQAKAQFTTAQTNLAYTEVRSPVDGVTSMIPYRVGALVSSAITEPLVTVSDDDKMYVYFSMSESQILNLTRQSGSLEQAIQNMPEVELYLSDGSLYKHNGKIDAISGTVDSKTGAVSIRSVFENPEKILRNSGAGKVVIPTVKKDCIAIPKAATYELQNKIFVFKVVDGKAQSAPIEVLNINDGVEYIVENGLQVGDVIIAQGAGLVREGAQVTAQQPQSDSVK